MCGQALGKPTRDGLRSWLLRPQQGWGVVPRRFLELYGEGFLTPPVALVEGPYIIPPVV